MDLGWGRLTSTYTEHVCPSQLTHNFLIRDNIEWKLLGLSRFTNLKIYHAVKLFYPFDTLHSPLSVLRTQRRRIKTEEKAKVVASVWEEEFIQFLEKLL